MADTVEVNSTTVPGACAPERICSNDSSKSFKSICPARDDKKWANTVFGIYENDWDVPIPQWSKKRNLKLRYINVVSIGLSHRTVFFSI